MKSSYASGFGRLKALSLDFLTREQLYELARAKDVGEVVQRLAQTAYKDEIESLATVYKPPELIEVAVNRHLVKLNAIAVQTAPLFGKSALMAYLSKWDIENIEVILAAKSLGRGLEQTEAYLVSSRNIPLTLSFNAIPYAELNILLQQPDMESAINYLVKYGYGAILLQQLGEFRKSGDLGVFTAALQSLYYSRLLWELRFLQGDEGVLREYVRAEITKRNLLNLLKSRDSNLDREVLSRHLVEGGLIATSSLLEAYNSPELGETIKRFEPWIDLTEALESYRKSDNLTEVEVAFDKLVVARYLTRFRSLSISLTSSFAFVLQAEYERQNIRRITYAKQYGMTEDYIKSVLLIG
jgi:V/A-type H+/Na+-transporting ATPase subunit C